MIRRIIPIRRFKIPKRKKVFVPEELPIAAETKNKTDATRYKGFLVFSGILPLKYKTEVKIPTARKTVPAIQ